MKKNFAYPPARVFLRQIEAHIPLNLLLSFMRFSFFVLFLLMLSAQLLVANNLRGQDLSKLKINIGPNNASLNTVLEEIQHKTNLRFAFKEPDLSVGKKFSIPKAERSVKELLDLLFKNQNIGYSQIENNIVLFRINEARLNEMEPEPVIAKIAIAISGKVSDDKGESLIGVSVYEKGTSNGVVTDVNGNFKLSIHNENAILVFSYIGYLSKEVHVGALRTLKVTLIEDKKTLDDVVVIGYGGVKRKDATGAVTLIKPDASNQVKATTTTDLLVGKVAGLQVTQGSGSSGSQGTVRIRQGASLNASNDPLIVIDGLTEGNLSSVNPDDIESITVLKDASASAIYGARGANGVIIVKTKRGTAQADGKFTAPEISYRGDFFVNQNITKLKVYNADDFRTEYTNRGWNTALLGTANTNWQDEISRTSFTNKHTLSITGAAPYVPYRISLGAQDDQGTIIGSKSKVSNILVNVSPKFFSNHLSVDATVKNTHYNWPQSGGSYVSAALTDPTQPIYYDYGPATVNGITYPQKAFGYFMYGANATGGNPQWTSNPLANTLLPGYGKTTNNTLLANALLSYKIHGFEDLTANFSVNTSNFKSNGSYLGQDNAPNTWSASNVNLGKGGLATSNSNHSTNNRYVLDYYLNYKKSFGKHDFDVTAGHTYESNKIKTWSSETRFTDGTLTSGSVPNATETELNLASYFGRVNYIFDQKYLFTATLRTDASSRFAPETRWGYFPSAAFAWKLNEESFLKNVKAIDELKFRMSYGVTGQQNIDNVYAYQATYYASTNNYMYREGDTFYTTYKPAAFDRKIKWETTNTFNVGLDYALFNNRVYGALDVYSRYTSNLLMHDVKVAAGSNFAESLDQNIGEMSSKGVEFAIGFSAIKKKDISWNLNFNFAYNTSKIERLAVYDGPPESTFVNAGNTSSNRYVQFQKVGNTPYTFFLAKQAYDANGVPIESFINPAYNPNVPGSQQYVTDDTNNANKFDTGKSSLAPYYGGFSTQFKYKNYDLGMNAHYAFGQYVYWTTMSGGSNNSFFDASSQYPTNTYVDWAPNWSKQHYYSDYWLFKGDYLKIDNVVAGYTFKRLWNNTSTLRVAAGVQNVATITNYPGVDPEVYSGLDGSGTPRPRMYMISASVKF